MMQTNQGHKQRSQYKHNITSQFATSHLGQLSLPSLLGR